MQQLIISKYLPLVFKHCYNLCCQKLLQRLCAVWFFGFDKPSDTDVCSQFPVCNLDVGWDSFCTLWDVASLEWQYDRSLQCYLFHQILYLCFFVYSDSTHIIWLVAEKKYFELLCCEYQFNCFCLSCSLCWILVLHPRLLYCEKNV